MRFFLLLTGWALFCLSLALPAMWTGGGFGMMGGTFRGWLCLGGSVPGIFMFARGGPRGIYLSLVGLCNLLMLASPALYLWGARSAALPRTAFLAAAFVVCLMRFVGDEEDGTQYLSGYYLWCASFVVVAVAFHFN